MFTKNSLALLADYGGDSSDEEVPGSRCSTKRMHKDDGVEERRNKRFERLPVPNFAISNPEEVIDDPTLHEGRIRSFQHERGNWATYVFIPYETNEGLQHFTSVIKQVAASENLDLKFFEELHLSLTRTVILKHHWIDSFIASLKINLASFAKFMVMFDCIEVYCNEEKTRTFIGLHAHTGYDTLLRLVQCLDNCLEEFHLPKFYENPSFHISIAWALGDQTDKFRLLLPHLNQELRAQMEISQEHWYIYVQQVLCKTGNKLFQFHL